MSPANMNREMCPLCKKGANVNRDFETHLSLIQCEVCGIYKLCHDFYFRFKGKGSFLKGDKLKKYEGKEYILSGVTRNASERENTIEISHENIANFMETALVPATPRELLNRVLVYIAKRADEFVSEVQIVLYKDYPLFFAKSYEDLNYVISS
jgi:hypothetical protein